MSPLGFGVLTFAGSVGVALMIRGWPSLIYDGQGSWVLFPILFCLMCLAAPAVLPPIVKSVGRVEPEDGEVAGLALAAVGLLVVFAAAVLR